MYCRCSLYQVLMAAPHPGIQPRQMAPPVPLPPGMFHSDESALCQSSRCAALCAECPSGTCLEQKGTSQVKNKTNSGTLTSRAKEPYRLFLPRSCPGLQPAPTSAATPARTGRSTWKWHNRVKVQVGTNSLLSEAPLKTNAPHITVPLGPNKFRKLMQGSEVSIGEQRRTGGVGSFKLLSDTVFT